MTDDTIDESYDAYRQSAHPGERWSHDRRVIAGWLLREAGGHFDGAETRADGSTFIAFPSHLGQISVHDYWSFARPDFDPSNRQQSYAQALSRQVPVLTLGYGRPGTDPAGRAELVVFLAGEVVTAGGYGEVFAPLVGAKQPGELIAIESTRVPAAMGAIDLYSDPFLVAVIGAIGQQTRKPPAHQ